jgi:hypothetical protein
VRSRLPSLPRTDSAAVRGAGKMVKHFVKSSVLSNISAAELVFSRPFVQVRQRLRCRVNAS